MDKEPLIVVSLCAVILLVLGSLSNVVGYQSVQTSQQNLIKERINQRELLIQTIMDIANNKEIQRVILKSQINRGIFPVSDIPVITKNQLKKMYVIGFVLLKIISKSRFHSMIEQSQLMNPELQKKISAVIEKDTTLQLQITQLQNEECDCENENTTGWHFPVLCMVLYPIVVFTFFIMLLLNSYFLFEIMIFLVHLVDALHCVWAY